MFAFSCCFNQLLRPLLAQCLSQLSWAPDSYHKGMEGAMLVAYAGLHSSQRKWEIRAPEKLSPSLMRMNSREDQNSWMEMDTKYVSCHLTVIFIKSPAVFRTSSTYRQVQHLPSRILLSWWLCYTKYPPWTSGSPWELVRNAESKLHSDLLYHDPHANKFTGSLRITSLKQADRLIHLKTNKTEP